MLLEPKIATRAGDMSFEETTLSEIRVDLEERHPSRIREALDSPIRCVEHVEERTRGCAGSGSARTGGSIDPGVGSYSFGIDRSASDVVDTLCRGTALEDLGARPIA
jgi:hypothetical protein